MFLLVLFLICLFISVGVGVLAGISDVRGLTIPNFYSLAVVFSFLLAALGLWFGGRGDVFSPLWSHFASGLVVFSATFAFFAFRLIGAGDSKLATAFAFWFSLRHLVLFLFFMSLCGAVLGVVALVLRRWKPFKSAPEQSWVGQVQAGASKVPYGVAIAFGMVFASFYAGYFDARLLSSFFAEQIQ